LESDLKIAEHAFGAKKWAASMKKELHAKLNMSKFTFSRYSYIGERLRVLKPIKAHLPEGYSLLEAIARLSDTEIASAVKAGVINPKMMRSDLDAWKAKRSGKETRGLLFCSFYVNPSEMTEQDVEDMSDALIAVQQKFGSLGCDISLPCLGTLKEWSAEERRRVQFVVREAKRRVAEVKKNCLASKGKLSKAQKEKVWGFTWDETHLDGGSGDEDAKRVLETIGIGDEWEKLFNRSHQKFGPGSVYDRKMETFARKTGPSQRVDMDLLEEVKASFEAFKTLKQKKNKAEALAGFKFEE
jgi:hypothetical protein